MTSTTYRAIDLDKILEQYLETKIELQELKNICFNLITDDQDEVTNDVLTELCFTIINFFEDESITEEVAAPIARHFLRLIRDESIMAKEKINIFDLVKSEPEVSSAVKRYEGGKMSWGDLNSFLIKRPVFASLIVDGTILHLNKMLSLIKKDDFSGIVSLLKN